MQSVSSLSATIQSIETQLDKITLQSKLQEIIVIIKQFQSDTEKVQKKRTKSKKKENDQDQNLSLVVQSVIQKQIKGYLDKLESSLKKYWYTDMESKLYIFLTDLKQNWDFFQEFFQVDESVDFLEESVHNYVLELKKQRALIELDDLIEAISNTFDYWPTQKSQKCLELANFLGRTEEIKETLYRIQRVNIIHTIENCSDVYLLTKLPNVFPLLQDKQNNQKLHNLLEKKLNIEIKNKNFDDINSISVRIEETIIRGKYWDQTLEREIVVKLSVIEESKLRETIKKIIELLNLYYSENINNNSIITQYPELQFINKIADIDLNYEGTWSLNVFFMGKWIPGYKVKDSKEFSNLEFNQEGEWKNRKFKCFSWNLRGSIPIGTILKLTNKKESIFLIVTNTSSRVRDINLTAIDENLIRVYFSEEKSPQKKLNTASKDDCTFLYNFIKLESYNLKLALKLLSVDKAKISILTSIFSSLITVTGEELKTLLSNESDKKFLHYLSKIMKH